MSPETYKNYCLRQLDSWVHDALNCEDITPQEIFNTIEKCIVDNVDYHRNHLNKNEKLLSLIKTIQPSEDYSYDLTATGEKISTNDYVNASSPYNDGWTQEAYKKKNDNALERKSIYYYDYSRNDPNRANPFETPDYTEL